MQQMIDNAAGRQADGRFRRVAAALAEPGKVPGEDVDAQLNGEKGVKAFEEGNVVGVAVSVEQGEIPRGELAGGLSGNPPSVDDGGGGGRRRRFHGDGNEDVLENDAAAPVEVIQAPFHLFFRVSLVPFIAAGDGVVVEIWR